MPHRRHRVRVHVHNRYVRTQSPHQTKRCKKRCRNGSRCRSRYQRANDDPYRLDDDCDRPIGFGAGQDGRVGRQGCQRFHSAEEVCRRGCDGARGQRGDDPPYRTAQGGRYGGYESDRGGGACDRCGRNQTAPGVCGCKSGKDTGGCSKRSGGGSSRPGTPCERFKSAEETCRSCPRRPGQRQEQQQQTYDHYRDDGDPRWWSQDAGRTGQSTSYNVYTAQVQQLGFAGELQYLDTPNQTKAEGTSPPGQSTKNPCDPNPAQITEEIIHTREHRWHIPSVQPRPDREDDPASTGPLQRPDDPCGPEQDSRRADPGSSHGSQRSAARSRRAPAPPGESGSDGGRRRPAAVAANLRRTHSELLAGREIAARIARQVELDYGTRAKQQLVYRLSAQYGDQLDDASFDSESGLESGPRRPLSEPDTERTNQTARAQTVLRLERLRLEETSDTSNSSAGYSESPRPAPRSARPAEPPSPLPRRQVTSEPTLPAPSVRSPAPATRTTRSLDCQPAPAGVGGRGVERGRAKKLRTRGALTRLRERSVTRLDEERQRQLLTEQLVAQTNHQSTGKPPPDRPSDADDSDQRNVTVLHAQNLLPTEYQGPGSRGDAAAEPLYQNIDTLYDGTATKPGDKPGYSGGGGGFSPAQPATASPYLSRVDDPSQPGPAQYGDYENGRSPYLATSPTGRSARARFEDDDQLGAALYEERYQPRRDNSPYLSRPTGRATAAPGTDIRAGAAPAQTGARLRRQGGQQMLGSGARRGVGIGQRLSRGFSSLRQRGAALYRRLSGSRRQGVGRGRGRGRDPLARPASGAARKRCPGEVDSCSCTDSESDCGAINCSFLFYFNGDGSPSSFMRNMPAVITGAGNSRHTTGAMSKKYCDMCK